MPYDRLILSPVWTYVGLHGMAKAGAKTRCCTAGAGAQTVALRQLKPMVAYMRSRSRWLRTAAPRAVQVCLPVAHYFSKAKPRARY